MIGPGAALLAAALAAAPALAAPPEPADLPAAVRAYNARRTGAPGWRRAVLELRTGTTVTRRMTISNAWAEVGGELRTLFVLEEPPGLRGTSYLLAEPSTAGRPVRLHLLLPAGEGRVLEVAPRLHDQGLLGSDLSYRDLCWRLPLEGYQYRSAGETTLLGRPVSVVEAVPPAGSDWARLRHYLSADPPLLLGTDYFREGEASPAKALRVEALEQRGKVWTPTRIVASLGQERSSVLTLQSARFDLPPRSPALFAPEALPGIVSAVRSGERLESLLEGGAP